MNRIKTKEEQTKYIVNDFAKCKDDRMKEYNARKYRNSQKTEKYQNDYVSVVDDKSNNGPNVVFNKYVMLNEIRAWEVQRSQYADNTYVMGAVDDAFRLSTPATQELVRQFLSDFNGSFEKKMKAHAFTYNDPFADEDIGEPMEDEEMIDEENIPEEEGDAAERDFIDEILAEEDNNGRDAGENIGVGDGMWQAMDAPIAWNPGRYAIYDDGTMRRATNAAIIDHDNIINPAAETVRTMRDELDRLTAELANTITVDNTNNMIYYDPATLRGAVADATRGAMATDDGEGHG